MRGADTGKEKRVEGKREAPSRKRRRLIHRSVTDFEEVEQIGEGTYGQVWMARDRQTDEIVALKKVRMDNERDGFPITAVRELKLLKSLQHDNIVNLKEIVVGKNRGKEGSKTSAGKHQIYMVFEYMDHDLTGLMDTPSIKFTEAQVKTYAKQLLQGLWYCHQREILHRDIKGSNLLIDNQGNLKIADFGLARTYDDYNPKYTNKVITLWYRPPELLLGATEYGPAVDMWSAGCLIAELLLRKPLLPGKNEIQQAELIFTICGSPTEESWPGWTSLPSAYMVQKMKYNGKLRQVLRGHTEGAIDLVEKLLTLDPSKRISAHDALYHSWFYSKPYPTPREELPKYESTHEFQAKQRRKKSGTSDANTNKWAHMQ